ncbi:unnamed protein product [Amoebophrya sp. A25]|nr:unnamed protein product [Amoebophrya sp. A25]|eukprot:GSA25T00007761001.1
MRCRAFFAHRLAAESGIRFEATTGDARGRSRNSTCSSNRRAYHS